MGLKLHIPSEWSAEMKRKRQENYLIKLKGMFMREEEFQRQLEAFVVSRSFVVDGYSEKGRFESLSLNRSFYWVRMIFLEKNCWVYDQKLRMEIKMTSLLKGNNEGLKLLTSKKRFIKKLTDQLMIVCW